MTEKILKVPMFPPPGPRGRYILRPTQPFDWNPSISHIYVKMAPPFYYSPVRRVHRVRSVTLHYWNGKFTHTSVILWCGAQGWLGKRKNNNKVPGTLTAEPPDHCDYCATCEGRAIGAGQLASRKINGRMVLFTPKQ